MRLLRQRVLLKTSTHRQIVWGQRASSPRKEVCLNGKENTVSQLVLDWPLYLSEVII